MEILNPNIETLVQLRKEIHKHPELSGKEFQTARRITSFLEKYSPDELITGVGTTGIIAIYKGTSAGKKVLFRAELDALPIDEINAFEHKSVHKSISHKCGHDGHITILCGLAIELHHNRPETGTVVLLFQPAEENGLGASNIISNPKFNAIKPDYVFALHNLPRFPIHQIVVKNNTFTCAVNSIIIKLNGKTAHAAEPEKGINPALAIASISKEFDKMIQSVISEDDYCLITPIYIKMGKKAYGISAGAGEIHFTVRCNSDSQIKIIKSIIENKAKTIAEEFQLDCKIKWTQSFHANQNDEKAVNYIRKAAKIKNMDVLEKETPFTWGEDFGLFTQRFPGAMFGIGSGINTPALHNPDYDFPDSIISTGITIFHQISKQITDAH